MASSDIQRQSLARPQKVMENILRVHDVIEKYQRGLIFLAPISQNEVMRSVLKSCICPEQDVIAEIVRGRNLRGLFKLAGKLAIDEERYIRLSETRGCCVHSYAIYVYSRAWASNCQSNPSRSMRYNDVAVPLN